MDSLISVISELRQINSIIGSGKIELPQIVTVGSQSSGKSSVLESVVGWDFLPRGVGVVTRRPLVLNLVNVPEEDPRRIKSGVPKGNWATFLHMPGKIFTNFQEVREEIEKDTIKVVGDNQDISKAPISLTIYSENVIDLSLVDLPGTIRVPLENQSATIKEDIDEIIDNYLRSPKSLILAVTPANQDIATSDALECAKRYDPEGKRTLCVLTKIDIMDKGTDANDMLNGKTIPVKLGIIGVINRSQAEIKKKKNIEKCLEKEEDFFRTKYPLIASKNGRKYLTSQLNNLLLNHILEHLPKLRDEIDNMAIEQKAILESLGKAPSMDQNSKLTMNKIIRNFATLYKDLLNGNQDGLETKMIIGGASIDIAFREFSEFSLINPEKYLTLEVVLNALRNSHGTTIAMFIPEHSFIQLSKQQIKRLKDPSVAFVDTIKNILLEIVDYCTKKISETDTNRFPRLYKRINNVACDTINQRLPLTKIFVEKVVDMHLSYINIRHPEFDMEKVVQEASKDFSTLRPIEKKVLPPNLKGTWNKTDEEGNTVLSTPESESQQSILNPPDNKEMQQCVILKNYVIQYYNIVRNSLHYMLPKAIMMELVNYIKDNLHEELEKNISFSENVVQDLIKENETITEKRKQAQEKITQLDNAKALLQKISEANL